MRSSRPAAVVVVRRQATEGGPQGRVTSSKLVAVSDAAFRPKIPRQHRPCHKSLQVLREQNRVPQFCRDDMMKALDAGEQGETAHGKKRMTLQTTNCVLPTCLEPIPKSSGLLLNTPTVVASVVRSSQTVDLVAPTSDITTEERFSFGKPPPPPNPLLHKGCPPRSNVTQTRYSRHPVYSCWVEKDNTTRPGRCLQWHLGE